jgi:hypothetical protein
VAYYLVSNSLSERSFEKHPLPLEQLLNAQRSFYTSCRYAEYHLGLSVLQRQPGPYDQGVVTWLEQIREANRQLANKYGFESVRAQAEKQNAPGLAISIPEGANGTAEMDTAVLDERGTPSYWQVESDSAIPRLRLVGLNVQATWQALGYSGLLVVLALSAWIVSYSSKFVRLAQALWPEEIALVGLVAWQALGAHVVFALLALLGLSIRLWHLGRWTAKITQRRKLAAATAGDVSSTT